MLRLHTIRRYPAWPLIAITIFTSLLAAREEGGQRADHELRTFLQRYLKPVAGAPDISTRIVAAQALAGNGHKLQVIYVTGDGWCGSGGCTLLILEPKASAFKVIGRVSVVRLPIRLLPTWQNGYPEIGVGVQGGGIVKKYEAVLGFDGTAYPSNPTLVPARPPGLMEGKEIISSVSRSTRLYP